MIAPGFASLCVLSYERPAFLAECLNTLRDAGYPYELLVHDDGSRSEVANALRGWVEDGEISTLVTNPPGHNQGQGVALNRMFHMAAGDPMVKLDQDLVFEPGWLARVIELFEAGERAGPQETSLGLLGGFHYHHDPCNSTKTLIEQHDGWSSRTHILGSFMAVRRDCWQDHGPFDEHSEAFSEDWDFQNRVTRGPWWCCGLPDEDLVTNQGFGIGRSTVVLDPDRIQMIHKEPVIHGR